MDESTTKNMLIDIDSVKEGEDAREVFPFLKNIRSFNRYKIENIDRWNLIRYIVILYSSDSYLNKGGIPLEERKAKALLFAKIELTEDIEHELLNLNNHLVLTMVKDYLIAQNNALWIEIATTEQQYDEAIRLRLKPIPQGEDAKEKDQIAVTNLKKALREECKAMENDLKLYYSKFYMQHNDVQDKLKKKATTIESIAKESIFV